MTDTRDLNGTTFTDHNDVEWTRENGSESADYDYSTYGPRDEKIRVLRMRNGLWMATIDSTIVTFGEETRMRAMNMAIGAVLSFPFNR